MPRAELGPEWESSVAPTCGRTVQDVLRALHAPLPPELLQHRRADNTGKTLTHIPWQVVNRQLTYIAPGAHARGAWRGRQGRARCGALNTNTQAWTHFNDCRDCLSDSLSLPRCL